MWRRSKSRAVEAEPCAWPIVEVMLRGVIVRLMEGVVHMGVGLRFVPALVAEKKAEVTLRCLTDRAARSGES